MKMSHRHFRLFKFMLTTDIRIEKDSVSGSICYFELGKGRIGPCSPWDGEFFEIRALEEMGFSGRLRFVDVSREI